MIPRMVHRIWLGGEEPLWTRPFAKTWLRKGWRVLKWDDLTVRAMFPLQNQDVYDHAEEIAPDHVGQLRSDVLRYEILSKIGGLYVDTDLECLRPLDPLVEQIEEYCCEPRCFAAWEEQGRWVGNTLMGAEPGSPFLKTVNRELASSVEQRPGERPARTTGPQFLTRVWRRDGGLTDILPQRLIFPYSWSEVDDHGPGEEWPGEAYAVHHWANQRRERGLPVPA